MTRFGCKLVVSIGCLDNAKARARQIQAMLDAGEVKNRAELARRLELSRARITQILQSLKGMEN